MSKRVLVVGCGQLGSRHLQAAASLNGIDEIHIFDPNPDSLNMGKRRLEEISDLNQKISFKWFNELKEVPAGGDLCVVATQAKGRPALIKQIARELSYKKFLIEKIVAQSAGEYQDLIDFCRSNKISVWVNCKTRVYCIHKYIKSKLNPQEPIVFTDIGGNHGLGNNGTHTVDLFVFYDEAKKVKSGEHRIDSILHPSKRGKEVFDLSGSLFGFTDKGSQLFVSFAVEHSNPGLISIISKSGRFVVDHFQKFAYESYSDDEGQWHRIPIDEDWDVSAMSKTFISDILLKGSCELPTLECCFPAHEFIIEGLLPHFNRLLSVEADHCPIT